jgi:exonuclease III
VKGLASKEKRLKVFEFLKQQKFTICFLQELHCTEQDKEIWQKQWKGNIYLSGSQSNSKGIGIFINENLNFKVNEYKEILVGRIQMLSIDISGNEYILINIYGPNSEDTDFFNTIDQILSANDNKAIILGGDFNVVIDYNFDKLNGKNNTNITNSKNVNDIMANNDLHDIWRIQHRHERCYTWHSNHKPPIFCRLDYFLVTQNLVNSIINTKISTGYRSDHSIVYFNLKTETLQRGPGYFKLNNSILLHDEYQEKIRKNILDTVDFNQDTNPRILWELIKGSIRDTSIKYSVKHKRLKNTEETNTKHIIEQLETKLQQDPYNENVYNELQREREKLNSIYDERFKGILLRAKADWIEGAEKNSKYFASLEKKRAEEKIIKTISCNNQELTNQAEILKYVAKFFTSLYDKQEQSDNFEEFFTVESADKLTHEQQTLCEGPLNENECRLSLKDMQNMKSPGSDGLTVEFYKIFWNDIKTYLVNALNYSYETGELSELQKQSVISLIPKKDKNLAEINNWRPISLLNVDYKIATKSIANRIKKVIPDIINTDQTGFIKGRYIGENVRTINDVIEKVNKANEKGIIFFSDFEKAFDSLDHDFIFKCLDYFNFGSSFKKWVKLFYSDVKSCISNNGYTSEFFQVKRGVRQGCPLSSYLFIICIEILSIAINHNKDIKGIKISNFEVKQTLFADDASFFTDGSKKSFEALINTLDKFGLLSGLKLNTTKCIVMKIGSLRNSDIAFCKEKQFQWTSFEAKTLGIIFSNDKEHMINANLEPKIISFKHTLLTWKKWHLSLIGKIAVLKMFALPKLAYPLTVLKTPRKHIIKELNKLMFEFLWDSKPDKVQRNIIIQNTKNGGLGMTDIESYTTSLKASWVKRLLVQSNAKWHSAYLHELNKKGGLTFFKFNCNSSHANNLQFEYDFLTDILTSWCTIHFEPEFNNIKEQIIWNNSLLTDPNGNPLFNKRWLDNGILYVKDIYNFDQNKFYSFQETRMKFRLSVTEFMNYMSITKIIKQKWKTGLLTTYPNRTTNITYLVNKIKPNTKINKMLYDIEIKKKKPTVNKTFNKWEHELGNTTIEWDKILSIPYLCTIDTKLRAFQYKFLMKILPNNVYLYKCKLSCSQLCDFCAMAPETTKHMFWECQHTQTFWRDLQNYLNRKGIITNSLCYTTISIGVTDRADNTLYAILNFVIILAKYFIFKNKYTNTIPSLETFIPFLNHRISIEGITANLKNKQEQHNAKWRLFLA